MRNSKFNQTTGLKAFATTIGLLASVTSFTGAQAQEIVQIGLATQSWFPSIVAEAAQRQGFFEKEGIAAELTVYQSGAEAFTALAADAADVISSSPNIIARGRLSGVDAQMVAELGAGNYGWQLMVPEGSDIDDVSELAGKNVGITSAGSLSDMLARWTMETSDVEFTAVPLGQGLVPNLISGNVDAVVLYSPLSYQVALDGDGKTLLDYGTAMPEHLNSGWAASDSFIEDDAEVLRKVVQALSAGTAYLQENRAEAISLIAEINNVSETVAEQEYENVFLKLSATGEMDVAGTEAALDIYRIGGMTEAPPAEDLFTNEMVTTTQE
ncbi:ABC transporter substrate-binding protein [Aurantimonas sp. C2-6-R+9]|uniref:ABC transporter substrate-binding protein n=1 Tax=unclassified Aurantimonas TaxID=2638230 RepID=UPI002E194EEE|nr:ABC transporter substrate-binding protein [Aurantimonas sp. C2-6-R+9]